MCSKISYSLKLCLICIYSLMLFTFIGCDGGSSNETSSENPPVAMLTGQAVLGPLTNAVVDVCQYDDLKLPIYSTTTTKSDNISEAGLFDIPESILEDDALYVIAISGGQDIDTNDDGVLDDFPTDNLGTLHLVATGKQLKAGSFRANVLTDIVYQKVSYLLYAQYPMETIEEEINIYSKSLIKEDINSDGNRDIKDLLIWDPVENKDIVCKEWSFFEGIGFDIIGNQIYAEELSEIRRGVIGTVNSSIDRLCVSGNYVYALNVFGGDRGGLVSTRLEVIDISDPVNPFIVGFSEEIQGMIAFYDVIVKGNYVFAVIESSVNVFDVSDPSQPIITGDKIPTGPGEVFRITIASDDANTMFVCSSSGLSIIDITDLSNAALLDFVDTPGGSWGVSISGDYAYLANGEYGLQVIDILDPSSPVITSAIDTPGTAYGVFVSGNIAYVADDDEGLQLIDVSTPTASFLIGSAPTPRSVSDVTISGDLAYMIYSQGSFRGYDIQVANISDPEAPKLVGSIDVPDGPDDLVILDGYAYVASRGFQVLDINVDLNPFITGSLDLPGNAYNLEVREGYAFIAGRDSGLQVIDFTSLSSPVSVGSVAMPGEAYDLSLSGEYAFVREGNDGLQVIDITEPEKALIVGSYNSSNSISTITLSGSYAYVKDSWARPDYGIQIIDISNPFQPLGVSSIGIPYNINGLVVSGNYLYVANSHLGLQVVDISETTAPLMIGAINTPDYARDVALVGDYAYVADQTPSIQVIDIGKPDHPAIIGEVNLPSIPECIKVSGNYAYVPCWNFGIQILDISDSANPIRVAIVNEPYISGQISDIGFLDDHIIFLDGTETLYVFRAIPNE